MIARPLALAAAALAGLAAAVPAQAPPPDPVPAATTARAVARPDTADSRLGEPLYAPAITYTPETGIAIGLGAFAVTRERRPFQRPDAYAANVLVTQRGQFTLGGTADVWTRDNRVRVESEAAAIRFPNRFFGLGLDTPTSGERYTPTTFAGSVGVQRAVVPALYLGVRVAGDRTTITGVDPAGRIAGYRERDGWSLVTVSVQAIHDTRDRIFAARRGAMRALTLAHTDGALGSTFDATRVTLDLRQYATLHRRVVVAAQGRVDHVMGALPFDRLPQLGGPNLLRGYFAGRFRDRSLGIGQAEVRLGPWAEVFGVTVFAAAGGVGTDLDALRDVRFRRAAGAGVRFIVNPQSGLGLRVDWARGEQGSRGWYITVGEAF
ncbi:MAG: BamA/TamA family outer membrane protein [Gemmatimonadota bacterium]